MQNIRVLVVDDHDIVRRGIIDILSSRNDVSHCTEVPTGTEALELLANEDVDLMILDISLPDMSGLEVLGQINALDESKCKVIIISMYSDRQYVKRAMDLGALGYVIKQTATEELSKAIEHVLKGRRYLSNKLYESVYLKTADGEAPSHLSLSPREFDVMILLAKGVKPMQVAEEMEISKQTVNTYRTRILEKLGLYNNVDITKYCLRQDLISND